MNSSGISDVGRRRLSMNDIRISPSAGGINYISHRYPICGRSALSTSMNLSPPSVPGSRTPSGMRPPLSPARTSLTKKRRLDPRLVGGVSLDIQGFVAWLFLFLLSDNHLLVSVECSTFHSFHGCGIPHPREEQKALLSTGSTRRQNILN